MQRDGALLQLPRSKGTELISFNASIERRIRDQPYQIENGSSVGSEDHEN